jgi:hypothetical protein
MTAMDDRRWPRRPELLLRKMDALQDLRNGPLTGAWNGMWGQYPTVTVYALVRLGWAEFNEAKTEVTITPAGVEFLEIMESVDG